MRLASPTLRTTHACPAFGRDARLIEAGLTAGLFTMSINLRKFFVGLFSLAVLLGLFLLYMRLGRNKSVEMDAGHRLVATIPDVNVSDANNKSGTIAGVEVFTVRQSRFLHRNKDNQVDREFGFESLLHESGDQWEIEKPYMNIFLPNFNCSVTADKGNVRVETVFDQATPSDATFSGNVVIHIVPAGAAEFEESVIYLDDVAFVSKRSLFSSSGALRFISASAHLVGSGLELVYDDILGRLGLFRITKLHTLRLRSSAFGSFPKGMPAGSVKVEKPAGSPADSGTAAPPGNENERYYQCTFYRNVVVRTPEQVIVADNELCMSDVLWLRPMGQQAGSQTGSGPAPTDDAGAAAGTAQIRQRVPPISDKLLNLPEELFDIVITCDGSVVVAPMNAPAEQGPFVRETAADYSSSWDVLRGEDISGRTLFRGQRIHYNASTKEAVASGRVRLTFYVDPNDLSATGKGRLSQPVTVDAARQATFVPALNRVVFDGDCVCTAVRNEPNGTVEYKLAAPKLTCDLAKRTQDDVVQPTAGLTHARSARGFQRISTAGGSAKLTIVTKAGLQMVGGAQLEGTHFDYDLCEERFIAAGPGTIRLNNSAALGSQKEQGAFSLRQPCYAFLRNFDTLEYLLKPNRFVAAADSREIILDYFPVVNGRYGPHVRAVVGHVEAQLERAMGGEVELASIAASKGVTYEDDTSQFVGSELFYDRTSSTVNIKGDADRPCYFNSALVDAVEINLQTGKVKAQLPAPSILQVNK